MRFELVQHYNLWTEGYKATGDYSPANYHGQWAGDSFQDAIQAFKDSLGDHRDATLIDVERETFWGCKFFDNETDARRFVG